MADRNREGKQQQNAQKAENKRSERRKEAGAAQALASAWGGGVMARSDMGVQM